MKVTRKGGRRDIRGTITYERLPTFCYWHEHLGHSNNDCEAMRENIEIHSEDPQYRDWLKVSSMKKGSISIKAIG